MVRQFCLYLITHPCDPGVKVPFVHFVVEFVFAFVVVVDFIVDTIPSAMLIAVKVSCPSVAHSATLQFYIIISRMGEIFLHVHDYAIYRKEKKLAHSS